MERNKAIILKLGIAFLIVFLIVIFVMKKENKENEKQVDEWQVKQDDEAAIGSNLFYGNSTVEGNGSVYVLDTGMYGGKPVGEDDCYNIYRMKEGKWELFVSHPPYSTDINSVSNLIYLDGYIYYVLKEIDMWEGRTSEDNYICRISEEDGQTEWLLSCDMNFYIYEGEIYSKLHKEGTCYFYKMKLDGEKVEVLYSDNREDPFGIDYTVGGGCLYLKDGEQVLGINMKNGEKKRFKTDAKQINGLFYEGGKLYIYDLENGGVYQMDVKTGDEAKIIEGKILMDCIWVHDRYLYYVEGEEETEEFRCDLKAMNLVTGETLSWESFSFDVQPCKAGLEVVGSRVIASFCARKENGTEECGYIEKEIGEITDGENKKSMEMPGKDKEADEKKIIVVQESFQEDGWKIIENDETAIGYNLTASTISAEGNGCIYSTNMEMYGGEPVEEYKSGNIYRLKEEKWELFVSHPVTEESWYIYETSVYSLTYYNGYVYYILLRDAEPDSGSSGKNYSICRVSEQDGTVEELAKCDGNFFIYQDEIYYQVFIKGIRSYFKMKPDGRDKELIYFDKSGHNSYPSYADYAVGGGCLYLKDEEGILGINLETGMRKKFETNAEHTEGMFYEEGKLYVKDQKSIIWQIDVKTNDEINIVEGLHGWLFAEWIHEGYMFYVEWWEEKEGFRYDLKAMNLMTGESVIWDSISLENHPVSYFLEIVDNQVIIRFESEDVMKKEVYENRYFKKDIGEIIEVKWSGVGKGEYY